MKGLVDKNFDVVGKACAAKIKPQEYVDIHCHCLPGMDDGPPTRSEAIELCRGLYEDGICSVIATPHQLGRFSDCNEAAQIREEVTVLNGELRDSNIHLKILPGGDVRVDERICQLLEADRVMTLADGGKYILLELPHEVFVDIEPLLVELISLGIHPIISHPERHFVFVKQPKILLKWLAYSAHLQITAGSLLGEFGVPAQKAAWQFLNSGWASLVATDAHDLQERKPCMSAAYSHISIKLGEKIARLVCVENPLRILNGQDIRTVGSIGTRKCIDETVSSNL